MCPVSPPLCYCTPDNQFWINLYCVVKESTIYQWLCGKKIVRKCNMPVGRGVLIVIAMLCHCEMRIF